jgi:hypothetical protein
MKPVGADGDRSPDEAKRNPGLGELQESPHPAAHHAGYKPCHFLRHLSYPLPLWERVPSRGSGEAGGGGGARAGGGAGRVGGDARWLPPHPAHFVRHPLPQGGEGYGGRLAIFLKITP